jgi:hypothetical protein
MNATDTDDDEPAILFPALASDVGSPLIPASMVCRFLSILLSVICIVDRMGIRFARARSA